jgi:ribosomal protein L40E
MHSAQHTVPTAIPNPAASLAPLQLRTQLRTQLQNQPAYCLSCYHLVSRRATVCPDCGTRQQQRAS